MVKQYAAEIGIPGAGTGQGANQVRWWCECWVSVWWHNLCVHWVHAKVRGTNVLLGSAPLGPYFQPRHLGFQLPLVWYPRHANYVHEEQQRVLKRRAENRARVAGSDDEGPSDASREDVSSKGSGLNRSRVVEASAPRTTPRPASAGAHPMDASSSDEDADEAAWSDSEVVVARRAPNARHNSVTAPPGIGGWGIPGGSVVLGVPSGLRQRNKRDRPERNTDLVQGRGKGVATFGLGLVGFDDSGSDLSDDDSHVLSPRSGPGSVTGFVGTGSYSRAASPDGSAGGVVDGERLVDSRRSTAVDEFFTMYVRASADKASSRPTSPRSTNLSAQDRYGAATPPRSPTPAASVAAAPSVPAGRFQGRTDHLPLSPSPRRAPSSSLYATLAAGRDTRSLSKTLPAKSSKQGTTIVAQSVILQRHRKMQHDAFKRSLQRGAPLGPAWAGRMNGARPLSCAVLLLCSERLTHACEQAPPNQAFARCRCTPT